MFYKKFAAVVLSAVLVVVVPSVVFADVSQHLSAAAPDGYPVLSRSDSHFLRLSNTLLS